MSKRSNAIGWALMAACVMPSAALARQNEPEGVREAAREVVTSPREFFSPQNLTLQAGGGYVNFSGQGTQSATASGGSWTVRGVFGIDQFVALDGGYVGAAYGLNLLGEDGTLWQNGLEVLGRVGYPFRGAQVTVTPYVTLGVGWQLFGANGVDQDLTGIDEYDNVFTVPLGIGFSVLGFERLSFDTRFVYRPTIGSEMFDDAAIDSDFSTSMNTFEVVGMLGYRL